MVFLNPLFFALVSGIMSVFNWVKYGIYRLFTPLTEIVVKRRFKSVGVEINGKNRWDIQILNRNMYAKIGTHYTLALGEGYMDKSIDIQDIAELACKVARDDGYANLTGYNTIQYFNLQTKSRSWQVGIEHYDIGNNLYEAMLDPWMQYTCGYWRNATNLNDAQLAKMDLIARKLLLKPGMHVLDMGCGFGSLANYLAKNYDVHVIGCTISAEQVKFAKERFAHPNVDIRLVDYRDMDGKFDRIVSIGLLEHVGEANYSTFFSLARKCLKDDGIFLVHSIGICDKNFPTTELFNQKYIFPNGILPRQTHITKYINGLFYIEDWHNFGHDYSKTLAAWEKNFNKAWPTLEADFNETFYRMWTFYLCFARGLFQSRKLNLWQIVLSKKGLEGGYLSVR